MVLHSQHRRKHSRRNSRHQLEGTARLRTVAHHTRQVGDHILHGKGNSLVPAAHQVGDAATRTGRRHDTAAQGRKTSQALLDIDSGQMAQNQRTHQVFLVRLDLLGINDHRQRSCDALVAAARITHHRNHGSRHAGVAGRASIGENAGEGTIPDNPQFGSMAQSISHAMPVVVLERVLRRSLIQSLGFQDEADFIQRCGHGEVEHFAQVEFDALRLLFAAGGTTTLLKRFAVP